MNKKVFYVAPDVQQLELDSEGVLCSSEQSGSMKPLEEGNDWSDMWN